MKNIYSRKDLPMSENELKKTFLGKKVKVTSDAKTPNQIFEGVVINLSDTLNNHPIKDLQIKTLDGTTVTPSIEMIVQIEILED